MKTLLSQDQLRDGVRRLADEITLEYEDRPLTIIGILTGSVILLADLIRQLELPVRVGVIQARSYRGGSTRPGPLVVNSELLPDIRDRDVLLIDDIFDTGQTLLEVISQIDDLGPRSIRSAVLLRKLGRQTVDITPDHVVFDIPDEFVVGYGLDYRDAYRNLPYVAALEAHELRGGE
ncbi:MAG: hypoxanthine phosphoribosyltransferase [Planctomycetes bacterium]|nr:hypoxanthine phosphoribosyltransferase [Planctomycetota bacterium]